MREYTPQELAPMVSRVFAAGSTKVHVTCPRCSSNVTVNFNEVNGEPNVGVSLECPSDSCGAHSVYRDQVGTTPWTAPHKALIAQQYAAKKIAFCPVDNAKLVIQRDSVTGGAPDRLMFSCQRCGRQDSTTV